MTENEDREKCILDNILFFFLRIFWDLNRRYDIVGTNKQIKMFSNKPGKRSFHLTKKKQQKKITYNAQSLNNQCFMWLSESVRNILEKPRQRQSASYCPYFVRVWNKIIDYRYKKKIKKYDYVQNFSFWRSFQRYNSSNC